MSEAAGGEAVWPTPGRVAQRDQLFAPGAAAHAICTHSTYSEHCLSPGGWVHLRETGPAADPIGQDQDQDQDQTRSGTGRDRVSVSEIQQFPHFGR